MNVLRRAHRVLGFSRKNLALGISANSLSVRLSSGLFSPSLKKPFLTLAALSSLTLSASAQINTWTGSAGNNNFFDAANWSLNEDPYDSSRYNYVKISNGSSIVGTIDADDNNDFQLNEIGYGSGANAEATINFITSSRDDFSEFSLDSRWRQDREAPLLIGGAGGTGTLNLNLSAFTLEETGVTLIMDNGFLVGSGWGGSGTFNIFGSGKNAPHNAVCVEEDCSYNIFFASPDIGRIDDLGYSRVGYNGGTGTLNLHGIGLNPEEGGEHGLNIGEGFGSNGTVNVFSQGKISNASESFYSEFSEHEDASGNWDPLAQFQVGVAGGQGTLNIDNSSGVFVNSFSVGTGVNSVGNVNLFNGGKGHSFIGVDSRWCPPGYSCPGGVYDPATIQAIQEGLSTKVGIDGGTGSMGVYDANSIWYVSGIYTEGGFSDPTTTADFAGELFIGYSGNGSLTVGKSGTVKIGTGTMLNYDDPVSGIEYNKFDDASFMSDGILHLGYKAGSTGVLNIGAAAGSAPVAVGTLEAARIQFGAGTGAINFNHTDWNYEFGASLSDGVYGNGTMRALAGRTLLNTAQLNFTGTLEAATDGFSPGILQVNADYSANNAATFAGGIIEGTGIIGNIVNAGTLSPGSSNSAIAGMAHTLGTLTIAGNYTGNGGIVAIDTVLGNDSSPTDLLVIQGNVSGNSYIHVTNQGGLGAFTTGDGIRIIQVDGTSPGNAFSLQGDFVTSSGQQAVVAGAYAYTLWHNGVSNPADGHWYLRSEIADEGGSSGNGGGAIKVLYNPVSSIAEVYPRALLSAMNMGTHHQRTERLGLNGGAEEREKNSHMIWAQAKGQHSRLEAEHSTTGTTARFDDWSLRTGIDGQVYEDENNSVIAGMSVKYGGIRTDVKSDYGNGTISTTGVSVGSTLTWYHGSGFYLDAQSMFTLFNSDLSSDALGVIKNKNHGQGIGLSLEAGYDMPVSENWFLTPQAQLSYTRVAFDSFHQERYDTYIALKSGDDLTGRLGLAINYRNLWEQSNRQMSRMQFYGIANLYYGFLDGTRVSLDDIMFKNDIQSFWGGAGLGGSYKWSDGKYAVFGEATTATSLKDFGDSYIAEGRVGFKVKW